MTFLSILFNQATLLATFHFAQLHPTCTVPDRSNLTGNALLERKWNAKWNAAGTPKGRQNFCGAGTRSEQERVLLRMRECVLLTTYGCTETVKLQLANKIL